MSVSFSPQEKYSSDLDAPSDRQLNDWMSELEDHVHVFPEDIEGFFSVFVPNSAPKMRKPVSRAAFLKYNPKDLRGKYSKRYGYGNMLEGLRATVSSFPIDKRPRFFRHRQEDMPFPFPEFTSNHIKTSPDLSVCFPGITFNQPDWQHIALFVYMKANEWDDPFEDDPFEENTPEHRVTVVNLAVGARDLMVVHGHCAAFALVICAHQARIVRFDHSCAVVSPAFSLKRDPGYLQTFFWRLFHPLVGRRIVGCDPTIRKLTSAEERWLVGSLESIRQAAPSDLATCLRVEAWTPDGDGVRVSKAYFTIRLINLNPHLMSLATAVWHAIEDPRILTDDDHLCDLPEASPNIRVVILKDTWRQLARRPEQDFFSRNEQVIPEEERVGLPIRAIDYNLGETEVQQWRWETGKELCDAIIAVRDQISSDADGTGVSAAAPPPLPAQLPIQHTCTWRIIHGLDNFHHERNHMRTITNTTGRPLAEFKHTRQLCQAIRDAIAAHQNLWENAKILHRDVSAGNILIVDDSEYQPLNCVGFLYDLDYSSMVDGLSPSPDSETGKGAADGRNLKERTEMDYFTAIDLLESPGIKHEVWHDLESFLWVFIWVVVHHTDHTHPGGCEGSYLIFGDRGWTRATLKRAFLFEETESLIVRNNHPLSQLIVEFKRLARKNVIAFRDVPRVPMTHDKVLEIFDRALTGDRVWPPANTDGPLSGCRPGH